MKWTRSRPSARVAAATAQQKYDELLTPESTADESNEDVTTVPGRDPDFGTSTSIKTFYEGEDSDSDDGHYNV